MNCPACRNILQPHQVQMPNGALVSFNVCTQCSGIWLNNFEMTKVMKLHQFPDNLIPSFNPVPGLKFVEEGQRACPTCGSILTLIKDHSINVDICKVCKAVWFDGNELRSLFIDMRPEVNANRKYIGLASSINPIDSNPLGDLLNRKITSSSYSDNSIVTNIQRTSHSGGYSYGRRRRSSSSSLGLFAGLVACVFDAFTDTY